LWRPKKTSSKGRILSPTGEFTLHRIFVSLESSPFSMKQINFFVKKRKRKEIEELLFVLSSSSLKSYVFK
jgi:hypothetical protein